MTCAPLTLIKASATALLDELRTGWFRAPHKKYGTTHYMINLIVIMQPVAIISSRGNTYALGEAYAFGVVWSFAFKALAMVVLRFKDKSRREWEDISLIHKIWLDVSKTLTCRRLHHGDVVRAALERLQRDLRGQTDVTLDFYRLERGESREKSNHGRGPRSAAIRAAGNSNHLPRRPMKARAFGPAPSLAPAYSAAPHSRRVFLN